MTKENRERAYKHFLFLSTQYVAPSHLNSGLTSTSRVRAKAAKTVKAMLKSHPELADQDGDVSYSDRSKEELKKMCTSEGLKFTSKSTKDDLVVLLENKSDAEVKEEVKE